MRLIDHINPASSKITVTDTATLLYDLLDTAGSVSNSEEYYRDKIASGMLITIEGDLMNFKDFNDLAVRFMVGNVPTADYGTFLISPNKYFFPLLDLARLKLIRCGTVDVPCSIDLVIAEMGDFFSAVNEINLFYLYF